MLTSIQQGLSFDSANFDRLFPTFSSLYDHYAGLVLGECRPRHGQ
jgi:hypothetical protein